MMLTLSMALISLLMTCWWSVEAGLLPQYDPMPVDSQAAFRFIDEMQNPTNCTGIEYAVSDMGCGGGFAAHFQLAASEWWRTASAFSYKTPVLIIGHIKGYSDGKACEHVNKDWTCFFQPMSSCQDELLKTGRQVSPPASYRRHMDITTVPPQFAHRGAAWWWGMIQARMFRFQPHVWQHIIKESSHMDKGRGFPYSDPVAGLHVRHGDKGSDGFRSHSFETELDAMSKSRECILWNAQNKTCFVCRYGLKNNQQPHTTVSTSSNSVTTNGNSINSVIAAGSATHGGVPAAATTNNNNNNAAAVIAASVLPRTATSVTSPVSVTVAKGELSTAAAKVSRLLQALSSGTGGGATNTAATGADTAAAAVALASQAAMAATCAAPTNSSTAVTFSMSAGIDVSMAAMRVFVASDDPGVLASARSRGHLVDSQGDGAGVSQQTAGAGMFRTLVSNPEKGFNASLEIITDIYFLSRCSTLVGIAASQVFRMAVGISNSTGRLRGDAMIMDFDQMHKIMHMSNKYHIPLPEKFINPKQR